MTLFNSAQEIIDTLRTEDGLSLGQIIDFLEDGEELVMYGFCGKGDWSMIREAREIAMQMLGYRETIVDGRYARVFNDGSIEYCY